MLKELKKHLSPLLLVFIFISLWWVFAKVSILNYFLLFLGLSLGSFFLDIDHLIYWFYTHPSLEESRLAKVIFKKNDFKSLLKLLETTHKSHTELTFHHISFQLVLLFVSIFVFTSTSSVLGASFLLSLNIHLAVDELDDFLTNKQHLQNWLFSRLDRQLPLNYLKPYLIFVFSALLFFTFLLLKSKL